MLAGPLWFPGVFGPGVYLLRFESQKLSRNTIGARERIEMERF